MIVSRDGEQIHIRVPHGMRDAIAKRAAQNGRAMNSEIVQILNSALRSAAAATGEGLVNQAPVAALNPADVGSAGQFQPQC